MKLMRWAMGVAAFAFMGNVAVAEDYVDVQALQAKLAAQEARLNDLHAKMYGSACEETGLVADGLTTLRKNATITLGGTVNTRYDFYKGKLEQDLAGGNDRERIADVRHGGIAIADAKLEGKIDVNEYFDAYFKFDLQDGNRGNTHRDWDDDDQYDDYYSSPANVAQQYWVRWKNVCNTGFGLLVGRDSVKFGGTQPYGRWDSWNKATSDMGGGSWAASDITMGDPWEEMALDGGMPVRADWTNSRTVQVTPYWETQDGRFKAEVSFFQNQEDYQGVHDYIDANGIIKYRRANNGWGSVSARLTWQPVDGLTLRGSVMNLHAKHDRYGVYGKWDYSNTAAFDEGDTGVEWKDKTSKNNFAMNVGFEYRPAFFNRANLFASWTHSWNDAWVKKQNSDSVTFGAGFDICDNFTIFGLVDYVNAKAKRVDDTPGRFYKGTGWAHEIGAIYSLPYGVSLSAGWRHEKMNYKDRLGNKHTKLTRDGFYAQLGFDF